MIFSLLKKTMIFTILVLLFMITPITSGESVSPSQDQVDLTNDTSYIFHSLILTDGGTRDWNYQPVQTVRVESPYYTSEAVKITQQSSVVTSWNVPESIHSSLEIETAFLTSLLEQYDVHAKKSVTWTQGSEYGVQVDVPMGSVAFITKYAVAVQGTGQITYKKYTGGNFVGYDIQHVSGWALTGDAKIEISGVQPNHYH